MKITDEAYLFLALVSCFAIGAFFCLVFVCECDADRWTPEQVTNEWIWQGLNLVDAIQSDRIARTPDKYYEKGIPRVFWGEHPSRLEMAGTMAAWGAVHWWVSDKIPNEAELFGWRFPARDIWQNITIGLTGSVVCVNFSIGIN